MSYTAAGRSGHRSPGWRGCRAAGLWVPRPPGGWLRLLPLVSRCCSRRSRPLGLRPITSTPAFPDEASHGHAAPRRGKQTPPLDGRTARPRGRACSPPRARGRPAWTETGCVPDALMTSSHLTPFAPLGSKRRLSPHLRRENTEAQKGSHLPRATQRVSGRAGTQLLYHEASTPPGLCRPFEHRPHTARWLRSIGYGGRGWCPDQRTCTPGPGLHGLRLS